MFQVGVLQLLFDVTQLCCIRGQSQREYLVKEKFTVIC